MAYATQQEMIDRYGEETILLAADRDGNGLIDDDAVTKALDAATSEIDSYVAAKYSLPLADVPDVLVQYCCDIALYRLSNDAGTLTEEKRTRYEDARTWLTNVSKGVVSLGVEDPPASIGGPQISSNDRLFNRDDMEGLG